MSLQLFATIVGGALQMQAQQEQAAIAAGNAEHQAKQREIDLKLQKVEASQRATLRLEEFENALATNEALFATMRDREASPYTTVGAFLGGGLTLVLGFFQFGLSIEMLILLLIFVSGQLLESYYLTPKFVGNAINLNPIWIMFALLTGAHLAGFVGVLISLPIAAIFGVLVRHYIVKLF